MTDTIKLIKTESKYLIYLLVALLILFKVVFYKESITILARTVIALFWLFILPGFSLMYIWQDKFDFLERLISGTVLGIALIGLASYYFTLFNVDIRLQYLLTPVLLLVISAGFILKKQKKLEGKHE